MDTFLTVVQVLTPVILGIFGVISTRRESQNKKYRKVREELETERAEAASKELKIKEQELVKMNNQIHELSNDVSEIRDSSKATEEKINNLSRLTKYNLDYTQEINNVLVCMGESMMSDNPDKNRLKDQLEDHRHKTAELTKKLYQITY